MLSGRRPCSHPGTEIGCDVHGRARMGGCVRGRALCPLPGFVAFFLGRGNVPAALDARGREPRALISCSDASDRNRPGAPRGAAAARLAGFPRRSDRRPRHRRRDLAVPGRARNRCRAQRRRVRAVAGDVDRGQRAAALQHRRPIRTVRRVPHLGAHACSERPPHRPGADRLLLRRAAGGHRGLRRAGRDHQFAPDLGGLSAAGGVGLHPDLQHRPGRVRRPRRAGDGARGGDRPACTHPRRHGGTAASRDGGDPAVLRDGASMAARARSARCGRCCWSPAAALRSRSS